MDVNMVCPLCPNILKNTGTTDKISQQSGNLQECNAVSEIPKSSKLKLFKYFSKQLFLFRYRSDRLVTITSLSKIGFWYLAFDTGDLCCWYKF